MINIHKREEEGIKTALFFLKNGKDKKNRFLFDNQTEPKSKKFYHQKIKGCATEEKVGKIKEKNKKNNNSKLVNDSFLQDCEDDFVELFSEYDFTPKIRLCSKRAEDLKEVQRLLMALQNTTIGQLATNLPRSKDLLSDDYYFNDDGGYTMEDFEAVFQQALNKTLLETNSSGIKEQILRCMFYSNKVALNIVNNENGVPVTEFTPLHKLWIPYTERNNCSKISAYYYRKTMSIVDLINRSDFTKKELGKLLGESDKNNNSREKVEKLLDIPIDWDSNEYFDYTECKSDEDIKLNYFYVILPGYTSDGKDLADIGRTKTESSYIYHGVASNKSNGFFVKYKRRLKKNEGVPLACVKHEGLTPFAKIMPILRQADILWYHFDKLNRNYKAVKPVVDTTFFDKKLQGQFEDFFNTARPFIYKNTRSIEQNALGGLKGKTDVMEVVKYFIDPSLDESIKLFNFREIIKRQIKTALGINQFASGDFTPTSERLQKDAVLATIEGSKTVIGRTVRHYKNLIEEQFRVVGCEVLRQIKGNDKFLDCLGIGERKQRLLKWGVNLGMDTFIGADVLPTTAEKKDMKLKLAVRVESKLISGSNEIAICKLIDRGDFDLVRQAMLQAEQETAQAQAELQQSGIQATVQGQIESTIAAKKVDFTLNQIERREDHQYKMMCKYADLAIKERLLMVEKEMEMFDGVIAANNKSQDDMFKEMMKANAKKEDNKIKRERMQTDIFINQLDAAASPNKV